MNLRFETLESLLIYDESKQLYNFPYSLQFDNQTIELDFIFHSDDYSSQEEMLVERDHEISRQILNEHFMRQFEVIQEICLEENESKEKADDIVNELNERLDVLYYLFVLIVKLNRKKGAGENEVLETAWGLYDELLEMFILIEDFYPGVRKMDMIQRKKKFMELDNKNGN
jgi:hypothetical protein